MEANDALRRCLAYPSQRRTSLLARMTRALTGRLRGGSFVLMTGSLAAQAITLFVSPVLTRIYTAGEMGSFALYTSFLALLTMVSTARYDFAVVNPRSNRVARILVQLVSAGSCAVLGLSLAALLAWTVVASHFDADPTIQPWLWGLPAGVFLSALLAGYTAHLLRNLQYRAIAITRVATSICAAVLSVGLGWLQFGVWGLLVSSIVALLVAAFLSWRASEMRWMAVSRRRMAAVAKRYSNYPRIDLPSSLIGIAASQLPTLLFGALFGTAFLGYYAIVDRIFLAPLNIVGGAVGSVFRVRATRSSATSGCFGEEYARTFFLLLGAALVIFLPILAFGEGIFALAFGEQWRTAGLIAQTLAPLYLVRLVASPLSMSLYVRNRLKVDLIGQTLLAASALASIGLGWLLDDPWVALRSIVVLSSCIYLAYLAYGWRIAVETTRVKSSSA